MLKIATKGKRNKFCQRFISVNLLKQADLRLFYYHKAGAYLETPETSTFLRMIKQFLAFKNFPEKAPPVMFEKVRGNLCKGLFSAG